MDITKRLVQGAVLTAGVVGVVATSARNPARDFALRVSKRLTRDVNYAVGSAPGILYRLAGRRPDPAASDDVLCDRIRSELGPLEKHLGTPRVHVMVSGHVATLHGEVPTKKAAHAIERAAGRVSGVRRVESHLRAGA
jgi:osmotically-inducible protein OsmY